MDAASRLKVLEGFDIFFNEKIKFFSNMLNRLCWTEESLDGEAKVQCPINVGHWVPESSLKEHAEMCAWSSGGYLKNEKEKQPPSSKFFYKNSTSVLPVIIDKEVQASILSGSSPDISAKNNMGTIPEIPLTIDRTTVELTPQQRLTIYDYVVSSGKALSKISNVKMEDLLFDFETKNGNEKPKSELELLAEERDYKRRRQSYRAKNVHITKKSYTEVMKEVIENQINYLAETRKQEDTDRIGNIEIKKEIKIEVDSPVEDFTESRERKDISNSETTRHHRSHRHRSRSQERSHHKRKKSRSTSSSRPRHKHKKSHHKKKHKSH